MTSSTANVHVDKIDGVAHSTADAGGNLVVDVKTNPNGENEPENNDLQAIADNTNGAGTATAKVGQTGVVVSTPLTAGSTITLDATENLGLSATATTTSNNATARATLGTTPRDGEGYTNGGVLGSNLHAGGAILANVNVNNRTTATASSTSHPGSTAANAEAKLSDSYGIVDSNIQGSGVEINVENKDSLISSADTSSDAARATTTRGELTGIRFGEDQGLISSGNADVHVEVGTRGNIGNVDDSEEETVLESGEDSEEETVLESGEDSEEETVLESGEDSEEETVLESGEDSEEETVLESGEDSEEEAVLEPGGDSEEELASVEEVPPVLDPNLVSASAIVHGTGAARATLISGSNYGITGEASVGGSTAVPVGEAGQASGSEDSGFGAVFNLSVAETLDPLFEVTGLLQQNGLSAFGALEEGDEYTLAFFTETDAEIANGSVSSPPFTSNGATLVGTATGTVDAAGNIKVSSGLPTEEVGSVAVIGKQDDGGSTFKVNSAALLDGDGGTITTVGATIAVSGDATVTAEVANTFTTTAHTSTGDSTATAKTSGENGDQETIAIDLALADVAGEALIVGAVDNQINTTANSSTGNSTATSISGLTKGIRATKVDVDSNASILGQVHSDVTTSASTHGGGNAVARAEAKRPDNGVTFGGEKIGVDVDSAASANGTLTVNGAVVSEFDVDANNTTGSATATAGELQVTGVLMSDVSSHGALDLDGSATVIQDAKATTKSGGNASARVVSGPNLNALNSGQPRLDGITGAVVLNDVDGNSSVEIDGHVNYTGTATAENSTGNATANVGNGGQSTQDTVGTLLVTEQGVNSDGTLTVNGTTKVDSTASATTHSGAASAEVNADPVKGVKSNGGVVYQSNEDLIVNGQVTFEADVDASSTGANGNHKIASAKAILENAVGTDLSDLDSATSTGPNKLVAHGTIDADGHARTDLNAKAENTTGNASAITETQIQKGLIISGNAGGSSDVGDSDTDDVRQSDQITSDTSGPSADAVVQGSDVDLSGSVNSKAVADASTHGGGNADARAEAKRPDNGVTFGGEKIGVDVDSAASANGTLTVNGAVVSEFDVDANNTTGSATATAGELQVTGVLMSDVSSHGALDLDGSATVTQDAKATTKSGGNASARVVSGPNLNALNSGQPRLDGITGAVVLNDVDGKSSVEIDGHVNYTGTATAENSTGNATANVGKANQSLQDMVGVLTVTEQGVNSGGDLTINGTVEAATKASAKTHTGSAFAVTYSDPVKGVKANQNTYYQSGGDLKINGSVSFDAHSAASATGGAEQSSLAQSVVRDVIGIDLSPFNSQPSSNSQTTTSNGDIEIVGEADVNLVSTAEITTGSSSSLSKSGLVSGIVAESIVGAGDGSVIGDSVVSGYSYAYSVTGSASSTGELTSNGIKIVNIQGPSNDVNESSSPGGDIVIGGSGDVRGSGYIGVPNFDDEGNYILSPFDVESVAITGPASSSTAFEAIGIDGTISASGYTQTVAPISGVGGEISVNNGDIVGTGAIVSRTASETTTGAARSDSALNIFGIKNVNMTIGGSGNSIQGSALGLSTVVAESTTGDATATGGIGGVGISAGTSNVIGEIVGVADITNTVIAKTVTGQAVATAISTPIIGIQSTSISSAGDLTVTATASLDQVAYSESISMATTDVT